ncbi:UMP kinase [candidate division WOR-3 bacterium]|jgi:uridylate kinase|nr:UMP kinase [candidate division WOR-3 bacterium]
MHRPRYKRIVLKLSGEILSREGNVIDPVIVDKLTDDIIELHNYNIDIGLVIGGGNIVRGQQAVSSLQIDRVQADYMGMLSTVINSLAVQSALEKKGVFTRVMTAITMSNVAEPYIRRRALRHIEKGRIVIFSCGTGNPYFSTDTAAALRAIEIGADIIMKGTKVDGVFSSDPLKNSKAVLLKNISYLHFIKNGYKAMDTTAVSLCMENNLPIAVFNLYTKDNMKNIVLGKDIGTIIDCGGQE